MSEKKIHGVKASKRLEKIQKLTKITCCFETHGSCKKIKKSNCNRFICVQCHSGCFWWAKNFIFSWKNEKKSTIKKISRRKKATVWKKILQIFKSNEILNSILVKYSNPFWDWRSLRTRFCWRFMSRFFDAWIWFQ